MTGLLDIIALLLVAAAAVMLFRSLRKRNKGNCDDCHDCPLKDDCTNNRKK